MLKTHFNFLCSELCLNLARFSKKRTFTEIPFYSINDSYSPYSSHRFNFPNLSSHLLSLQSENDLSYITLILHRNFQNYDSLTSRCLLYVVHMGFFMIECSMLQVSQRVIQRMEVKYLLSYLNPCSN